MEQTGGCGTGCGCAGGKAELRMVEDGLRHDWSQGEIEALFAPPFNELLHQAQTVHRTHFDPNAVQVSTLLSIKTGACPEDCAYCPQSARYDTGLKAEKLMPIEAVVAKAKQAKEAGALLPDLGDPIVAAAPYDWMGDDLAVDDLADADLADDWAEGDVRTGDWTGDGVR